ncbi:MAG TPA: hypothetical protein VL405_03875 [Sphingomonas sp.]|nr:hypothetical protein [Sphingomonas sp.]
MDLNYLLARHQLSIVAGRNAASESARATHRAFAQAYAQRINVLHRTLGAPARVAVAA